MLGTGAVGLGFAALVPLGLALAGTLGWRRPVVQAAVAAFAVAGVLGLLGALVNMGIAQASTQPFPPGEAVQAARVARIVAEGAAEWILFGALLAASAATALVSTPAAAAGWRGWAWCSRAVAAFYLLAVVVQVAPVPPIVETAVVFLGGVLPLLWALWLAARLRPAGAARVAQPA